MSASAATLVVHTGGIGDLLLCCPALIRLAAEGPIQLLGRPERLVLAAGIATACHDMNRVGFESIFGEPSMRLRRFLSSFDRGILWMKEDPEIRRGFALCGITDLRAFPGIPPDSWTAHASEYYLNCLGLAGAPALRLSIAPGETPRDVILHPGSGAKRKNWPLDRFKALARALEQSGRSVTWCTGPAEEDFDLSGSLLRTDFLETLAGELAASRIYVGNDSGISHLAAAVGCRTIVIFGPKDPRIWAPRGENVTVVQGQPWPEVAAVLRATDMASRNRSIG